MVSTSQYRRSRSRERGFTLVELMIVISIIAILLAIAIPNYSQSLKRANESVLKQDLFALRSSIDSYTMDKAKAPQSLDELVSSGYLRVIPKDPITGQPDWVPVEEDTLMSADQTAPGISDVHSASQGTGSDGTAYATW
jgi:general secretion pathway protein G